MNRPIPLFFFLLSLAATMSTTAYAGSIADETAINSAATSSFTDRYVLYSNGVQTGVIGTNGNATAANVSTVSIHSLLPNHPETKIYVETQSWFCHEASNVGANGLLIDNAHCSQNGNIDIGYNSIDSAGAQVDDMVRRGIDGAIVNWYGVQDWGNNTMLAMMARSVNFYAGNFKLSAAIDKGAYDYGRTGPCATVANNTELTTCFIRYIDDTYGSVLIRGLDGRKQIFWFITGYSLTGGAIDWGYVHWFAATRGIALINNDPSGFDAMNAYTDGAYGWVNTSPTYLDTFFNKANSPAPNANGVAYNSLLKMGGVWRGFNDDIAPWSLNRHVTTNCGNTWLDTFSRNNAEASLPMIMVATWDDYAEGSEIETGIDNCLNSISVSISGSSLSWTSNFGRDQESLVSGSERTIDHYDIIVSADGGNTVFTRTSVSPSGTGSGSYNLSALNLPAGNYLVYLKAVGKASIQNHMSAGVAYGGIGVIDTVTISSPLDGSSVSSPFTVAFTCNSADAAVSQTYLDGALVGTQSSNTFNQSVSAYPGLHQLTLKCWNQRTGISYSSQANINVSSVVQSGVNIDVSTGDQVANPFPVNGQCISTGVFDSYQIYMDGVLYDTVRNSVISYPQVWAASGPGLHTLEVKCWDSSGPVSAVRTIQVR